MSDEKYALSVLQKNPKLSEVLKKHMEAIKKSKLGLLHASEEFSSKYDQEIKEGTKQVQRLLAEGKRKGIPEEDVLKNSKFYPTVKTPILNMLYFLMREHPDADKINFNRLTEDIDKNTTIAVKDQNQQYGTLQHDAASLFGAKESPEMESFIYENLTHDTFQKIKKLKALSKSPHKQEAFLAYTKCMEMCKQYSLEFDKIPNIV